MKWVEHIDIGDGALVAINVDNILFAEGVQTYRKGDTRGIRVDATRVCMAAGVARVLDVPYDEFLISTGARA
jgi:hypothetical protein